MMKKIMIMLSLVLAVSCFMPSVAYAKDTVQDTESTTVIEINEEDFKPIDYLDGASTLESNDLLNSDLERTPGDLLYEQYYVKVPARTSVRVGSYLSEYSGDWFRLEWDGATNYDPNIDIVFEEIQTGEQYHARVIHQNKGALEFAVNYTGNFRIWLRSLNYSDVTFYRVSVKDI